MRTSKEPAMRPGNVATRQPETVDPRIVAVERTDSAPTEAQVRVRAYEIYCARCDLGEHGDALTDWIAAESELNSGGTGRAGAVASAKPAATNAALERNQPAEAGS